MDGSVFQAARGYRLDPPEYPQGVSCDKRGPAIGPLRLLTETPAGFAPPPIAALNLALSHIFGQVLECAGLLPGLKAAAAAMNDGDIGRAMIATQLMRLPVLTVEQARRAAAVAKMAKASPDDPEHPGWPAGTEGGKGGQFRPKDAEADADTEGVAKAKLNRLVKRRLIRAGLRRLLSTRRVVRLSGEALSNLVPGLDAVGDAAALEDVGEMIKDATELKTEAEAGFDFAAKGPHSLEELRVSPKDEAFPSFDAFKKEDLVKRYGPAGDGYDYHHIVEQGAGDEISTEELQSTKNIIRIPRLLHEEINSEYGQLNETIGNSLRGSLQGKSYNEKWNAGVKVLREMGIIQ